MLNKYLLGSWKEERKKGEREGGRKKGTHKEAPASAMRQRKRELWVRAFMMVSMGRDR